MARQDKKGITFFMFISQKFENPPIDLFLKFSDKLSDVTETNGPYLKKCTFFISNG